MPPGRVLPVPNKQAAKTSSVKRHCRNTRGTIKQLVANRVCSIFKKILHYFQTKYLKMKNAILLLSFLLTSLLGFAQGVTTASMNGKVTDSSNEALVGVNVVAVHVPTNATYGAVTDELGNYRLSGMKVGGPYTVTYSYLGFSDETKQDIFLKLGESLRNNVSMGESSVELGTVEIVEAASIAGGNDGTSTRINSEAIAQMPTLNRNLNDFTRLTPQAKESFGGGFSIAGANARYNAIYIDGAVNNDVFGLAESGTNGGQTGASPLSIDILDQIQVVVSPYDVSLGGFAGGGINAVTKSGTNELKGTAYYFLQNEKLAGKTNKTYADRYGVDRERLAEYSNNLYGLSLGGPLVKDKLFFFANFEIQDDQTPVGDKIEVYGGNSTVSDLQSLSSFLVSQYNYNPGSYDNKVDKLEGVKLFGKIDYNINKSHKLTLRHQYTKAVNTDVYGTSSTTANFSNNGIYFPSVTNSFAAELNSNFGTKFSNNLILGITNVKDDRDPLGGDFPYIYINDGGSNVIRLGSEEFSTANQLNQNVVTLTDNFKIYKGDHTITLGTHNEFSKFYNLFVRQNYGSYRFASLADFLAGNAPIEYDRSYSLVDDLSGDGSKAAAEFSAVQFGLYGQDEWQVSPKLRLTAGLRIDLPIITTDPKTDDYFNQTALPKIAQHYDLQGAKAGAMPEGKLMFSPRLGFSYDVDDQGKTTLRGGAGIFTSRIPFVWPGGAFVNNGLTVGSVDERSITDLAFNPNPQDQYENENFAIPSGELNLFSKDFKYPQVFRSSLAFDHVLPGGIKTSLEGIFTKTLNNVYYQNVNSDPTVKFNWTNGPVDDRPVFNRASIDNTYSAVYLATNTNKGYGYNFSLTASKDFAFGLQAMAAYTYGDSYAVNEGSSSQNSSQWRGSFNVDGRNSAELGRSDFAMGHRVIASLNYGIDWTKSKAATTRISVFYNGESGDAFSYVYGGTSSSARNPNNETGSTSNNRSLIYIPKSSSEIQLVDYTSGGTTYTAAEQWASLDKFISDDKYLSANRGKYAEKNAAFSPFEHSIDVRLTQDINVKVGKLQLTADVLNFANLLNSNWGVRYNNRYEYQVLTLQGYAADGTTPTFTFRESELGKDRFDINNTLSRWRMRLGVRYTFE
jgi:hypothetical protein